MNLTISSINSTPIKRNPSFGLAKFSSEGLRLAESCSDIYECLGAPNEFQNPEFFRKKGIFSQAPFTKYLKTKIAPRTVSDEKLREIHKTITDCGATDNSHTNASFIKQLLASKKYIERLDNTTQKAVAKAAEEVFKKNWNNPELTKDETFALLEMARLAMQDNQYATSLGVIQKSDI